MIVNAIFGEKKGGLMWISDKAVRETYIHTTCSLAKPSRVPVRYRDPTTLNPGGITVPAKDGGS